MRKMAHPMQLLFLVLAVLACVAVDRTATALESSVLRLEVTANPYSYQIIEKATGLVLVSQSETRFTVGGTTRTATGAAGISETSTSLDATLSLSGTTDTAHVQFTFASPEVLQVLLTYDNGAPTAIREQFNDQGEHYYGIWEYQNWGTSGALDNRGANNRPLRGLSNPPVGSGDPSARAPFYVTSRRYGIYVESEASARYTVAVSGQTNFEFDTPVLKYHVIHGSYAEVLNEYNAIAGGALMPPLWAFDPIFWRDDNLNTTGRTQQGATSGQHLVQIDANNLQLYQIPASAIWLDRPVGSGGGGLVGWGNFDFNTIATAFPDPDAMIADLEARGMHLLVWITNRANNSMLTDPGFTPYLFNLANGWPQNYTSNPGVDLRQPAAYDYFKQRLQEGYVNRGVRGYKIDRGEQNEYPPLLENQLGVLMTKLAYDSVNEVFNSDGFVFGRNAHDKSRKHVAVWNGDSNSNFNGLIDSIKQVLRNGPILYPMTGSDTGGYSGTPNKEVFARWLQFSAYSTMMEILLGPNRTIWTNYNTGANAIPPLLVDIARKYTQAHHDLIPYTRSYLYGATQTGMPVMRIMPFAFPDDPNLYDTWNEYLFGGEILVAPVTTAGATSRSVYLPAGSWIDYNDKGTRYAGPTTITANAPLDVIPLYVKAGAIIPRGDLLKSNNNWTPDWAPYLRIEFFPQEGVASRFDYYTGSGVVPIEGGIVSDAVTLQFGSLGTDGWLEVYVDRYSTVMRNGQTLVAGTDFQYDAAAKRMTIPFAGQTTAQIAQGPHVDAGPDATIFKGGTFTSAGSFFQVGGTSWTATVDYGDGSGEQPLPLNVTDKTFSLSHPYGQVGVYNVVVRVRDEAGHVGSDTAAVRVVYQFSGFFPPVTNLPAKNLAQAGRAVPVKFSLSGNQGLNVFSAASQGIACDSNVPVDGIDATSAPGASGLTYDPGTDQYHYNWKTDTAWGNTCRQLMVMLNDGTVHVANFQFK